MKPDWDKLGSEYQGSKSVAICDVDCTVEQDLCSEKGIRGYPTIKYYTSEHPDGADYQSGRDYDSLKKFVEENLAGPGCEIDDQDNCSDKEKKYIEKMKGDAELIAKETKRLNGMKDNKMSGTQRTWLKERLNILEQLA